MENETRGSELFCCDSENLPVRRYRVRPKLAAEQMPILLLGTMDHPDFGTSAQLEPAALGSGARRGHGRK